MQFGKIRNFLREQSGARAARCPDSGSRRRPWARILASLAAVALLTAAAQSGQQPGTGDSKSTVISPSTAPIPDAKPQALASADKAAKENTEPASSEPKKQIADDSARLLKMATDLKSEVDKSDKDTLSLAVIRKADAIEKLAHFVKEKSKPTAGTK